MNDSEVKANKYVKENLDRFIQSKNSDKFNFDFSEKSLEAINEEIELFADHYSHMGDDGVKNLVNVEVGSYLIEVAKKKFQGTLYWNDNQPIFLIDSQNFEVHFQPFKKVKYLLENYDTDENVFSYWKTLIETIASSKEGDIKYV